jgi:hypothetical protein
MTLKEFSDAVLDWAVETLPELNASTYDHATDERTKPFPDVALEVVDVRRGGAPTGIDTRLAKIQQVQQIVVRTVDFELILVVDPEDPQVAEDQLKDFVERIFNALEEDKTLGNRVQWVDDSPRASFRPPFVEFDDGTRGRIVTLFMQAGYKLEV